MVKIMGRYFGLLLTLLVFSFFLPSNTKAAVSGCSGRVGHYVEKVEYPDSVVINTPYTITFTFSGKADPAPNYFLHVTDNYVLFDDSYKSPIFKYTGGTEPQTHTLTMPGIRRPNKTYFLMLMHSEGFGQEELCRIGTIRSYDDSLSRASCTIEMPTNIKRGDTTFEIKTTITPISGVLYTFYIFHYPEVKLPSGIYTSFTPPDSYRFYSKSLSNQSETITASSLQRTLEGRKYIAAIRALKQVAGTNYGTFCNSLIFEITNQDTSSPIVTTPQPTPISPNSGPISSASGQNCNQGYEGISTAIGCIPTDPKILTQQLLKFSFAIAGGVALLLMSFGAFGMITSAGNPDQLKSARERFTSAVIGLVFIIFSTLLLQIIGVDILSLPGFTR